LKFLGDENLDWQIVERLRLDGHEVLYVVEMEPGLPDDEVLNLANNEGAILLTSDKDFGELVFRLRRIAAGVVLIRLFGLAPNDILSGSWSEKNRTQITDNNNEAEVGNLICIYNSNVFYKLLFF
jgi:predicted nuclease of predicted toxin-antitoxin system